VASTPALIPGTYLDAATVTDADHACVVTSGGGVLCWGLNEWGQLGDGTTSPHLVPAEVSGLSSGIVAVSAGFRHVCAISIAGGIKCWGDNSVGQLGDGTVNGQNVPVDVTGLTTGAVAVSASDDSNGFSHTCALTTQGGVKCWGNNTYGQLGDGTTTTRSTPADVSNLTSGVVAISSGGFHSCALTAAGGVKCWGSNGWGQLGDGTQSLRLEPVDVIGLGSGVTALSAGESQTCAVSAGGAVQCWGYNGHGELGDGTQSTRLTPTGVVGLASGGVRVSTGHQSTCATTTDGRALCWGINDRSQLGDGTITNHPTPVEVYSL
jgi:alpha-tubulin suppressor-like RCC1 family protein